MLTEVKPAVVGSPTASPVVSSETAPLTGKTESKVSQALGRAWKWVKDHPSWTPGVSTVTGIGMGLLYSAVAAVSAAVLAGGVLVGLASALVPSERSAKIFKERAIQLITVGDNFLSTSLRLALRGFVSAVPVIGNGIIIGVDTFNGKDRERLFCLSEATGYPLQGTKVD